MAKGVKQCPKCNEPTGPAAKYCSCGHQYMFAPKLIKQNKVLKGPFDWRELKKGEFIKSVGGHGPFYPYKDVDSGETEIIPMGHYGIFRVSFVDDKGIGTHQVFTNQDNGGFCYLYMGEPRLSKETGNVMRPHKIKKVIRRKGK